MSRFVVDACALVKYHVPQPLSAEVMARLDAADEALAPDWALAECANVMWKWVRANQYTLAETSGFLDAIASADVDYRPTADVLPHALELAAMLGHPVYDCLYLALAMVEDAPALTTDRRFAAMATNAGLGEFVALIE